MKRHELFSKKARRRMRSNKWPDMRPHIFDKVAAMVPYVLMGYY